MQILQTATAHHHHQQQQQDYQRSGTVNGSLYPPSPQTTQRHTGTGVPPGTMVSSFDDKMKVRHPYVWYSMTIIPNECLANPTLQNSNCYSYNFLLLFLSIHPLRWSILPFVSPSFWISSISPSFLLVAIQRNGPFGGSFWCVMNERSNHSAL